MKYLTLSILFLACGSPSNDPAPKVDPPKAETVLLSFNGLEAVALCKSPDPIKGVCWGPNPDPTKANSFAEGDTVVFATVPGETYYVRAFSQNGAGSAYGESIMFKALCPSTLSGVATYVTSSILSSGDPCPASISGQITLTYLSDGVYSISDASFGVYACAWGDSPSIGIRLVDTCGNFTLEGSDQYGLEYLWSYSKDGDELTVVWSNDFGDTATTILTRAGGWD